MFSKAYRLKSNNALKNSEKKHLAQRIVEQFPFATEESAKELVPNKSATSCMKMVAHSGEIVAVYTVDNLPMIIEAFDKLYPTVCALWRVPGLVPTITIHTPIISKIQGGAPLYLPGVVVPQHGRGFPQFVRGDALAVNSESNAAAAVVGVSLMSSGDMLLKAGGVCMDTLHVLGDFLCKDPKFSKIERPKMGPATYNSDVPAAVVTGLSQLSLEPQVLQRDEWPSLGKRPKPIPEVAPQVVQNEEIVPNDKPQGDENERLELVLDDSEPEEMDNADDSEVDVENGIPTTMDGLLKFCLLSFLKLEGRKVTLPLKTSLLYRNHLVPLCPEDRTLDVKKSNYKKMGKFMEAMQREGLIQVKELEKGVDAITSMDLMHPELMMHRVPGEVRERLVEAARPAESSDSYAPPLVREMFSITAHVLDIFAPLKKGTTVTASDIRSTLTEYVRKNNLQDPNNRGLVRLDPLLGRITGRTDTATWEQVMSSVQSKMTACTEMRFSDGTIKSNKSKLEPIRMQVATRSGNKKVTLVSNLEVFGFYLPALSKVCQHGIAASCSITRTPGSKCDQLLVQGDQTYFLVKLLIEKYGIPKKFIEGADKALKKKK